MVSEYVWMRANLLELQKILGTCFTGYNPRSFDLSSKILDITPLPFPHHPVSHLFGQKQMNTERKIDALDSFKFHPPLSKSFLYTRTLVDLND